MIPYSLNPLGYGVFLTDLDILKQIREANPTSTLPSLWLDSEDPYTQWEGTAWNGYKCTGLTFPSGVTTIPNVNKLKSLNTLTASYTGITTLDLSDSNVVYVYLQNSMLSTLHLSNNVNLRILNIEHNLLSSVEIYSNSLTDLLCRYNNLPTLETNRLINLGYNSTYILPQN